MEAFAALTYMEASAWTEKLQVTIYIYPYPTTFRLFGSQMEQEPTSDPSTTTGNAPM